MKNKFFNRKFVPAAQIRLWKGMVIDMKHFGRFTLLSIVLTFLILCITGCTKETSLLEFSFSNSEKAEFNDAKSLFFHGEKDLVKLDSILKIEDGEITIQVSDVENNDVIWSNTFSDDEKFVIELSDIRRDSEYVLSVKAEETTKVHLVMTSDEKLAKEVGKPSR